jgi:hypothetical protein
MVRQFLDATHETLLDHHIAPHCPQEVIGSLIMGHTHSMISRSLYSKIRGILALCDINLPAWATVQASRTRIRKLLGNRINYCSSPFDTPTFSLDPQTLVAMVRLQRLTDRLLLLGGPFECD